MTGLPSSLPAAVKLAAAVLYSPEAVVELASGLGMLPPVRRAV